MKLVAEDVGGDEEEEKWLLAQAFAKDSRSTTWPPRSYMCTFCRRDFMSAQALGGHMNVHRRDRALLHHHHQAQTLTNYQSAVLGNNENMCATSFEVVQVKENKLPDHHHHHHQSNKNFTEVSSVPIEEIDLELRLGYL